MRIRQTVVRSSSDTEVSIIPNPGEAPDHVSRLVGKIFEKTDWKTITVSSDTIKYTITFERIVSLTAEERLQVLIEAANQKTLGNDPPVKIWAPGYALYDAFERVKEDEG